MIGKDAVSTLDLRSAANDQQRGVDQKHKWAYGKAYGPGRLAHDTAHARPWHPHAEPNGIRRDGVAAATFKARLRGRRQNDIQEYHEEGDSSAPEDVEDVSAAPEPDADVTFSFDAPRGPNAGSQIFSAAVAIAVERYEDIKTQRMIDEQYEVLNSEGEPIKSKSNVKAKPSSPSTFGATTDDDGFELV